MSLLILSLLLLLLSSDGLLAPPSTIRFNNNNNNNRCTRTNTALFPSSRQQSVLALNSVSVSVSDNLFSAFLDTASRQPGLKVFSIAAALVVSIYFYLSRVLWTPSRTYDREANSVGREYDAWSEEGILEYYWGEHIHLGYYKPEEIRNKVLPPKKNFIQAKFDFIDEMLNFGSFSLNNSPSNDIPLSILDVGCGIGGTSRYLAKKLSNGSSVTGITLSNKQAERAKELAVQQGVTNADFLVMDALNMTFPDNSFDYVWACESGEHMPDKKRYVEEMIRVLKPGGKIVIATWCQRDEGNRPFNSFEKQMLQFLYSEWTHPFFISINDYRKLMEGTGSMSTITTADWTPQTISSWLHSIWVGVFDPWPVLSRPKLWWKTFRDGLTLYRMHKSFDRKLMQYGMMTGTKSI